MLKSNQCYQRKEIAKEKLGVLTTEPSPESLLWGALHLCSGLDILEFEQTSLFYSASYFNWGGAWRFVSEGLSTPKPPVATGMCGKTSACFLMQLNDSEKYVGYAICQACKICQTSVYKDDKAQNRVATSRLALHWMCDSQWTGCVRRVTHIYLWRKQEIIEWCRWSDLDELPLIYACEASEQLILLSNGDEKSDLVISIVACCHSVKLCTLAAQAFQLQQWHNAFSVYSTSWRRTCVGTILPSFEHNWLKRSCERIIRRDNWLGFKSLWLGFRIDAYGQGLGQVFGLLLQCLELRFSLQVHLMQTRSG